MCDQGYCAACEARTRRKQILSPWRGDGLMDAAVLRAKFRVERVTRDINAEGGVEYETVKLRAVYGNNAENEQWSKWTPSGEVSLTISNPDAMGKVANGHEFYIDFVPVTP